MIDYTYTPARTEGRAKVFDKTGTAFHYEAVEQAPDFASLIDCMEDEIRESFDRGDEVNFKDLALNLLGEAKKQFMGELLIRLLSIFTDSTNIKADFDILISAAGLPIRSEPDSAIARKHSMSRQRYSARKQALLKKLNLAPPPHGKSKTACDTYTLTNRKNGKLE